MSWSPSKRAMRRQKLRWFRAGRGGATPSSIRPPRGLSSALSAGGVKPRKDVVAIYAARDASLVVALLGILQTGASFLILDPAYPAARTIDYLKIARPRAWIKLDGTAELAAELAGCLKALDVKFHMTLPRGKAAIIAALAHSEKSSVSVPVAARRSSLYRLYIRLHRRAQRRSLRVMDR